MLKNGYRSQTNAQKSNCRTTDYFLFFSQNKVSTIAQKMNGIVSIARTIRDGQNNIKYTTNNKY